MMTTTISYNRFNALLLWGALVSQFFSSCANINDAEVRKAVVILPVFAEDPKRTSIADEVSIVFLSKNVNNPFWASNFGEGYTEPKHSEVRYAPSGTIEIYWESKAGAKEKILIYGSGIIAAEIDGRWIRAIETKRDMQGMDPYTVELGKNSAYIPPSAFTK